MTNKGFWSKMACSKDISIRSKKNPYSYQQEIANQIFGTLLNNRYKASVLALACGGGKTRTSIEIIVKYLNMYPDRRVVVLTEGKNSLASQYIDSFLESEYSSQFSCGQYGEGCKIEVGIPQNFLSTALTANQEWLMVVDEAHNYFPKPSGLMSRIVSKFQPSSILLLTGTPSKFVRHNQYEDSKYAIHSISPSEIHERGIYAGVDLLIARVPYKKYPPTTLAGVCREIKNKNIKWSKGLFACPNIRYASKISSCLKEMGYKVTLSTSQNDPQSFEMQRFKEGEFDCLVIVNRGLLGFNDPEIDLLVDMRSTIGSLNQNFQIFARILRDALDGRRKSYIRVACLTKNDYRKQFYMLHKLTAFFRKDIYEGFDGKNLVVKIS